MSPTPGPGSRSLTCLSGTHGPDADPTPVPATVTGVFDASHINGRPAVDAAYCTRCAIALEVAGTFTPRSPIAGPIQLEADELRASYHPDARRAVETTATFSLLTGTH